MKNVPDENELNTVDIVTNTMFSLGFLDQITHIIFSPHRHKFTVGQFYDQWLASIKVNEPKIPFNPGIFVAYIYCGLLVTKETWYVLVPNIEIDQLNQDWGLGSVTCLSPKQHQITLPYFIRRLRNALGHANFTLGMPDDILLTEIHDRSTICFRDDNPKDADDYFETTLTWRQIEKLIKQFHGVIYPSVKDRHELPISK